MRSRVSSDPASSLASADLSRSKGTIEFSADRSSRRLESMESMGSVQSDMTRGSSRSSGKKRLMPSRRLCQSMADSMHAKLDNRRNFDWNHILIDQRRGCLVDVMLVFSQAERADDDVKLPSPGESPTPAVHSAAWYLKQVIADPTLFLASSTTAVVKKGRETMVMDAPTDMWDEEDEDDEENTSPEQKASKFMMQIVPDSVHHNQGGPNIAELYKNALHAKTRGEFRKALCVLMIGYILCKHVGFEARLFMSARDQTQLFVGVSARESVLRAHADLLSVKLQLAPDVAVDLLSSENTGGPRKSNATAEPKKDPLFDEHEVQPPFIYYDVDEEEQYFMKFGRTPFRKHYGVYPEAGSIFIGGERIRIITKLINQVFNTECMLAFGLLDDLYPSHAQDRLRHLSSSWATPAWLPKPFGKFHHVPLDDIASYFGTKLGFRICFLRFLSRQMVVLALIAPFLLLLPDQHMVRMLIALLLILWTATTEEAWKRKQAEKRVHWGMEDYHDNEHRRPQFQGEMAKSEIDRRTMVKVYPIWKTVLRRSLTWTVTLIYQIAMVTVSLSLYQYHDVLMVKGDKRWATVALVAVALQIKICDAFWDYFGQKLGNFDNYETNSQYNEALLQRTFGVRFIVSFAALFYTAFVKNFTTDMCPGGESGCLNLVVVQLRTVFLINMVYHFVSVLVPYLTFRIKIHYETKDRPAKPGYITLSQSSAEPLSEPGPSRESTFRSSLAPPPLQSAPSCSETQKHLPEYSLAEEVFDTMDVIVELGYVLFFGFLAPEILTLFFISNCLRVYALGKKLVFTMRRPFPDGSSGLGVVFDRVFRMMSRFAVACNIILVLLYNSEDHGTDMFAWLKNVLSRPRSGGGRDRDWKSILTCFFVVDNSISLLRGAIDFLIPDVSAAVECEIKRKDLVRRQLMLRATSDLKVWEGMEMERAYDEAPADTKLPQVLKTDAEGVRQWAPTQVIENEVLPWRPSDPHFEQAWFLLSQGEQEGVVTARARDPSQTYIQISQEGSELQ